jgi:kynurenine formamidase
MHRVILGAGVVIMEGLTNLARAPPSRRLCRALQDRGHRGRPARFFATV